MEFALAEKGRTHRTPAQTGCDALNGTASASAVVTRTYIERIRLALGSFKAGVVASVKQHLYEYGISEIVVKRVSNLEATVFCR